MRYATWLGSLFIVAAISPSASRAASEGDLVSAACSGGAVTVTAKRPWHTNPNAPWAWDKGSLISKDEKQVKLKGPKCEGTVKAYVVNGDQVKGPINVAIK
jgi:hypothetical protein